MKATIEIGKSFDDGRSFTKEYEGGDFADFFKDEGGYLDRLADIIETRGDEGSEFVVTYTVRVRK